MRGTEERREKGGEGVDDKDRGIGVTINDDEISNFLPDTLKRGKISEPTWKDTLKQIIASCIVHCIVIQAGVNMAYSTVLVGGLQANHGFNNSNDNAIKNDTNYTEQSERLMIDEDHESWIASLVTITLPIGSLLSGPLMDKFGRKKMCIAVCIPTLLSWILLIASDSLTMIYAARSIAGIAAGLASVGIVYVIEITHPRVRPMLLCCTSVFVSLGILLTCLFAIWLEWRQMAIMFLALNIFIFVALFAVPESPYWLIFFANDDKEFLDPDGRVAANAEKSLRWLNPTTTMYEQEYERLKETCRSRSKSPSDDDSNGVENINGQPSKSLVARCRYYSNQLVRPIVYKPMLLLFVILLMQQLSGAYVVIFYAISVFREIGGTFANGLDEYGALLLLGVIRFFMSVLTAYLSRTIGRRVLCIASGLGMAFAMFFSAMFIYLTAAYSSCDASGVLIVNGQDLVQSSSSMTALAQQKWLLLVIVLFYVCMSSLGFVVIPWTLIGELLPISFRGVGGGIMVSIAYLIMFAVIKSYPYALLALGPQNVFFLFSIMSLIGTSFVYLFLPETLGKSFKQIENYFSSGK